MSRASSVLSFQVESLSESEGNTKTKSLWEADPECSHAWTSQSSKLKISLWAQASLQWVFCHLQLKELWLTQQSNGRVHSLAVGTAAKTTTKFLISLLCFSLLLLLLTQGKSKGFLLSLLVDHNHRTINRPLGIKASLDFLKILTIELFSTTFLTFQTLCRMTPGKTETWTVPFYKNKSQTLFSILNYL